MDLQYLYQVPAIRAGLEHLLARDSVFKKMKVQPEDLLWGYTPPGFSSLVRIVIGQQLSTSAARSVWERFESGFEKVEPLSILALEHDALRALGLSQQKANYIRGLSEAVVEGRFDPHALDDLSDPAVYEAITTLKGFGTWSAEMYLMFSLARPDIWAPKDLGIQYGLQYYLGLDEKPDMVRTAEEGARFAPYRTAASLLLWHLKIQKEAEQKAAKAAKP